ncbi:DUF3221 domain-containing protein [Ornithinibacillus sp. BX22]|uniref:DUF3221 domain-containing protein n=1 Tax=Ornithinibacillus hominis TaxID=2763055 RepID=A0A923L4Q3_9BACI|nr:DUF3221 domain-containing protein [Ornithinibacillus hominis]
MFKLDKPPPYKRLLLACLLTLLFSINFKDILSEKETSSDLQKLPENYITIEGYIVSKRTDTIWIADESISIGERIFGFFTSNYGSEITIVSKNNDAENDKLFNDLKINQKVTVYGDYLIESNPSRISAYHVEVIKRD